jgi:sterol desaturase/sphingolipid hydroxylase (fatty acid hydroxylase superfamily)
MPAEGPPPQRRLANLLLSLYVIVCLVALLAPQIFGPAAGSRPFVLGMPFCLIWSVLWVLATFLALLVYDRWLHSGRKP